jgi:hypothetical protein
MVDGGSTNRRLEAVHEETLGEALTLAWRNTVAVLGDDPRGARGVGNGSRKGVR